MPRRIVVEKRKWDGSVSARWTAWALDAPDGCLAWATPAGTARDRPRRGTADVIPHDQVTVAPGGWWLVTAHGDGDGGVDHYLIDAALPPERPEPGRVGFVDLDLDLRFPGDGSAGELEDLEQFHERARTMGYPESVCAGAWEGLARAHQAYVRGAWPFDGWIAERLRGGSTGGGWV